MTINKEELYIILKGNRYSLRNFIEKQYNCEFKEFILKKFKCTIEAKNLYDLEFDEFDSIEKVYKSVDYYKINFKNINELDKFNNFVQSLYSMAELTEDDTFEWESI